MISRRLWSKTPILRALTLNDLKTKKIRPDGRIFTDKRETAASSNATAPYGIGDDVPCRFDIVAIDQDEIRLIKNAFQA